MKVVEVFNPDVIVFQSKHPKWNIIEKLKNLNKEIYVGPHPSYREKGGGKLMYMLKKYRGYEI